MNDGTSSDRTGEDPFDEGQTVDFDEAEEENAYSSSSSDWSDRDTWAEPVLFGEIDTPEITPKGLPDWLAEYIVAVSAFTQTPSAMSTMLALSMVATSIQRAAEIKAGHNDFQEPLSLWVLAIMPPASRKSPVISALTKPLKDWETEKHRELGPVVEQAKVERDMIQRRIDRLKKQGESTNA